MDKLKAEVQAMEDSIAQGDMSAAQVLLQMKHLAEAANAQAKRDLESQLVVGARVKIGPAYAAAHPNCKAGDIITLVRGEFEHENGLYTEHVSVPSIWDSDSREFDSIYHLFENDLSGFMDCEILPPPMAVALPAGFRAWLDAVVTVANATGMDHDEVIRTWPHYTDDDRKMFANHPPLKVGDVMELDDLLTGAPAGERVELGALQGELDRTKDALLRAQSHMQYLRGQQGAEHAEVWFWQGDGSDHPESMANSLTVVIRADDLRRLIAPQQPSRNPCQLGDRVLMPNRLTSENGAKGALHGEFFVAVGVECAQCGSPDFSEDLEKCGACGHDECLPDQRAVPWKTIKKIYAAAVELLGEPARAPEDQESAVAVPELPAQVTDAGYGWLQIAAGEVPAERAPVMLRAIALHILAGRGVASPIQRPYQDRVNDWMMECFGPKIAADREERNHRFLEEALELVQATGCTADAAHRLVEYVFGRDVGEPRQEVGGVRVTLAALCLAHDIDGEAAAETELARVNQPDVIERIREKQKRKPQFGPLPGVYPERTAAPATAMPQHYDAAVAVARQHRRVYPTLLQRHLGIAYSNALQLIDHLEARGVVGAPDDNGCRRLLAEGGES